MICFVCVAALFAAANGSPPLRSQQATDTVQARCGRDEPRPYEGNCATTPALGWIWNSPWTCHEEAICMQIVESAIYQRNNGFAIKVGKNDVKMISAIMQLVSKHKMQLNNPSIVYEAVKTYQGDRVMYGAVGASAGAFVGWAICVGNNADKLGYGALLTCLGSDEKDAGMLLGLITGTVVGEVVGVWHIYLDGSYIVWQLQF